MCRDRRGSRHARPRGLRSWASLAALLVLVSPRVTVAEPDEAPEPLDPSRLEFAVLPALNYDSDLGLGVGAAVVLAQFDPLYAPYRWRLEAVLLTRLQLVEGAIEAPFHDHYVALDVPQLAGGALRLNLLAAFQRITTAGWYGLGSEAPLASASDDRRFQQFERTSPSLRGVARLAIGGARGELQLFGGAEVSHSWMSLYPGSLLERDAARATRPASADDGVLSALVHGTDDHWLVLLLLGLIWDSRDHETVPSSGALHELSLRASPGVDERLGYAGLTLSVAGYWPLYDEHLVLAARLVGDVLFGAPPVYALASFGGLRSVDGPGGTASTRGVLLHRFHGKLKVLGNAELRARFITVELFEQRIELGAAVFADGGRVWADTEARVLDGRALDGGSWAAGLGGGLRYRWGETFLVRAELGYSPTDGTTGLYIDINQVF